VPRPWSQVRVSQGLEYTLEGLEQVLACPGEWLPCGPGQERDFPVRAVAFGWVCHNPEQ
jgi:hypothetical protein